MTVRIDELGTPCLRVVAATLEDWSLVIRTHIHALQPLLTPALGESDSLLAFVATCTRYIHVSKS